MSANEYLRFSKKSVAGLVIIFVLAILPRFSHCFDIAIRPDYCQYVILLSLLIYVALVYFIVLSIGTIIIKKKK
jgi:hypothetical protein